MFNKTIENLTIEDIEWLIQNNVVENQNLEYKQQAWGNSDSDKKEMLKDIVSMANKYGGYIILGIEEDEAGAARALHSIPNAEVERERILSSVFANTQSRLQSIKVRVITCGEVNIVVIWVPNSYKKPHMITLGGINQFYIRHNSQKMLMSIDEIKETIISTANITRDVDCFYAKRKQDVLLEIANQPFLVIGSYPIMSESEMIDVSDTQLRSLLKHPPVIRQMGMNFDFRNDQVKPSHFGLFVGSRDARSMQLYRNGYLEGKISFSMLKLDRETSDNATIINDWALVEIILSFTKQMKQIYSYAGYEGQVSVYCSLYNIPNYSLCGESVNERFRHLGDLPVWSQNHLEIGPLAFTEIDDAKIAKTIGDRIYQSFGYENEPYIINGVFTV